MGEEFQRVVESGQARSEYSRTRRVKAALKELSEQPFDEKGQRVVLRVPARYRFTFRRCAKEMSLRIQIGTYDEEWIKVVVLQAGESSGLPGRPPGPQGRKGQSPAATAESS